MKIYFRQDEHRRFYKHEAYNFLEFLGDLGGLYSILYALSMLIASPLLTRLYQASIVSKAYRVQTYLHDMTHFYPTR